MTLWAKDTMTSAAFCCFT
uniref:Uncharacterized protein n=1 Tax=Anguilla anguilla TaxID=7936 RepID=A0A0E9VDX3_ANGAN